MRFQLNMQSIRRLGKVAGKIGRRDAHELLLALAVEDEYTYRKTIPIGHTDELATMLEYVILTNRRTPFNHKRYHCSHEQNRPIIYFGVMSDMYFWLGFDLAKLSKYMTDNRILTIFNTPIDELYRAYCRNLQYRLDKLGYNYSKSAMKVNKITSVGTRRVIQIIEYYTNILTKHNGEKN